MHLLKTLVSSASSADDSEFHMATFRSCQLLEEREEFRPRWTGATDGLGKPSTPIDLLVLTALCYIGRAWTLDDLSENACIGEEVVRRFLHKFLRYASTKMVIRVFANFMKTHVVVDAADGRPQFW